MEELRRERSRSQLAAYNAFAMSQATREDAERWVDLHEMLAGYQ